MGDDQDGAGIFYQVLLQPGDGFGVKVVGRFVQKQHVGRFKQQLAQRHAAAFATRQGFDIGVIGRAAQGLHRDVDLAVEIPQVLGVDRVLQGRHFVGGLIRIVHGQVVIAVKDRLFVGHAQHDIAAHIKGRVKVGFLRQIADLGAFGGPGLALKILVHAGHDAQKRGFTRSVDTDNADLDTGQKVQMYVFKAFLAARIGLGDTFHVIDVLVRCHDVLRARQGWGLL